MAIAVWRGPALFALAVVYAAHGPVMRLMGVFSRRRATAASTAAGSAGDDGEV